MLTLNDRCLQLSLGTAYVLSIVVERNMRPERGYMHVLDLLFENKEVSMTEIPVHTEAIMTNKDR